MLRADQTAVLNRANVAIIGLRSAEVKYFDTFFVSFGTQSAIIAGFLCSGLDTLLLMHI